MSSPSSPWVVDVDQGAFQRAVIERSRDVPVVVDFWAPWCGPCRMLGPVLEKLAQDRQGAFVLAKVNIDEAPDLAAEYAVEAIPAVKAFRDGRPVLGFVGVLPEVQLQDFLDRIVPTESDRAAAEAKSLEESNPAEAEARYRRALQGDPGHQASLVGLARLLINRHQDAEARELLGRAMPGEETAQLEAVLDLHELAAECGDEAALRQGLEKAPDRPERLYKLGCVAAAGGRYQEALDLLLSAAQVDRQLASAKVREAMVKIFHVLGVRSELSDEYRDKLSRLLY